MSAIERFSPIVWREICHAAVEVNGLEPLPYRYQTDSGKSTIAALSATCKSLYDAVGDIIWHTVPDIAVLFYCLPDRLYSKDRIVSRTGHNWAPRQQAYTFTFVRNDFSEVDLVKLLDRAKCIKAIVRAHRYFRTPPPGTLFVAAPSAYVTLAKVLGSRILCPSLEVLDYSRSEFMQSDIFRAFHVLFGPNLKHFNLESVETQPGFDQISPPPSPSPPDSESVIDGEGDVCAMLHNLGERAKHSLKTFRMNIRPSSISIGSTTVDVLCHFSNLVSLEVAPWSSKRIYVATPTLFAHCAQLPSLTELHLQFEDPPSPHDWRLQVSSQIPPGTFGFPRLVEFDAAVGTLALFTQLFSFIGSPALEILSIRSDGNITRDELHPFFAALATLPAQESLRTFDLRATGDVVGTPSSSGCPKHPAPIDVETLEPLLYFSSIQQIVIDLRCPFDLDDALFEKMAKRWPNLDCLSVSGECDRRFGSGHDAQPECHAPTDTEGQSPRGGETFSDSALAAPCKGAAAWRMRPRATLLALFYFARHCPKLMALQLELDANLALIHPSLVLKSIVRESPNLCGTLCLGHSPIEDPYAVAAFLSGIFSALRTIDTSWPNQRHAYYPGHDERPVEDAMGEAMPGGEWWQKSDVYGKLWKIAQRQFNVFARVRKEERQWRR
ncbi:hypothetical protein GY45DRAFT_1280579 [Cubamyces sp. BRFM 1775]|nr:hypothetical protein GY45DRAFT_1280579 [Cubamyces sp. BRFM 1775]